MSSIFEPNVVLIANITNAQYAVITFVQNHNFFDNEYISLRVTKPYGMVNINNQRAKILSHDALTVTTDIDTTNYPAFITHLTTVGTPPCAVPSSSGVNPNLYVPTMILEDCFDNVPLN